VALADKNGTVVEVEVLMGLENIPRVCRCDGIVVVVGDCGQSCRRWAVNDTDAMGLGGYGG
jgi:hypothetical protein